jgi:hypothetical protein
MMLMNSFRPDLSVLPLAQKKIWSKLASIPKNFVLYGGTAIALQLGHRSSVDFDFFSSEPADSDHLYAIVSSFLGPFEITQSRQNTLSIITSSDEPVKLSFFWGIETGRVKPPLITEDNTMLVASLQDLFGHKLKTVLQRVEAKDYIDIAFLLKSGLFLEQGLSYVLSLWPHAPIQEIVRTLTYFQEGDFTELSEVDKQMLIKACSNISYLNIVRLPLDSHSLSIY